MKQFLILIDFLLNNFLNSGDIDSGVVQTKAKIKFVDGGDTRAKSILSALESEDLTNYDYVLTHDVARPNISKDHIRHLLEEIQNKGSDCIFF